MDSLEQDDKAMERVLDDDGLCEDSSSDNHGETFTAEGSDPEGEAEEEQDEDDDDAEDDEEEKDSTSSLSKLCALLTSPTRSIGPNDIKSGPFNAIHCDDVLMGRGKCANNHPGNQYFRYLLEETCDAYATCTRKGEKTQFTNRIVEQVKQRGRFMLQIPFRKKHVPQPDVHSTGAKEPLEKSPQYVEISDRKARAKVGQVSLRVNISDIRGHLQGKTLCREIRSHFSASSH